MNNAKSKLVKRALPTARIPTQKTFSFREQMRAGAAIADQLPKAMTLKQVSEATGLSRTYIRNVECLALYKLQKRMKELMGRGEFEPANHPTAHNHNRSAICRFNETGNWGDVNNV
jgi:hypothetical protein